MNISNDAFKILLFLCPGYLGFRVYFIDKPWNSISQLNVFYGSLIFSIFAYLFFGLTVSLVNVYLPAVKIGGQFSYMVLTIPFAVVLGLLWRSYGHEWFHGALFKLRITNEDNNATPWMKLFNNPKVRLSQITVHLKDGSVYQCDETECFDTEELRKIGIFSHYTCIEGDIYLVANRYKPAKSEVWRDVPNINIVPPWGIKIQWFPAREIARVEARAIDITSACLRS